MMRLPTMVVFAMLAAGCGRVNPEPAFRDSAAIVHQQTGLNLEWARSAQETTLLEQKVAVLLEHPLTLDSAVQIALLNNRSLQAHFEKLAIAQADAAAAGLPSNPDFGLSVRFPDRPPSGSNLEIGLSQNLLDFLVLPRRKKIAAIELEQTKLGIANAGLDLVAEVKTAFFTLLGDLQLEHRLQLMQDINEAAAELARRQREAGTLNDLDLAGHVAAFSQSRVDVALARSQTRVSREKVNRLLGLWGENTGWRSIDELPPIPESEASLEGLESRALRLRPDLQVARLGVDLIGQALALKRGTRFFPVGIEVGVDTERETDRAWVTGPTLGLQLPIFDFGRTSIARLEAQQLQAQRELEALSVDTRSEVRELRDLLLAHRELTEFYRDVLLPQRVELLEMTLRHYNMMLKGVYDLLLARQQVVEVERSYIEAWRGYWLARTRLERALGGSTDGVIPASPEANTTPTAVLSDNPDNSPQAPQEKPE